MKIINRFYTYLLFLKFWFLSILALNYKTFLNLPLGEYQINYKSAFKCNPSPGNKIHQNLYFFKLTNNTTVVKGNLTFDIPLDDTFTFHVNMATKDSTNGWKDNTHVIVSRKACTTLKNLMGKQWPVYLNSFGITDQNCPIRPGVYATTGVGYDLSSVVSTANLPRSFFYGTYKSRLYYKDNRNVEHGCIIYVIEIKRPGESD